MDKPTKVLIFGVVLGAVVVGVSSVNTHRLERKVEKLRIVCMAEGDREASIRGSAMRIVAKYEGKLLCDPGELARAREDSLGIQGQLARVQRAIWRWQSWAIPLGIATALLCVLPWSWYFLLRRICELRKAIIGK